MKSEHTISLFFVSVWLGQFDNLKPAIFDGLDISIEMKNWGGGINEHLNLKLLLEFVNLIS